MNQINNLFARVEKLKEMGAFKEALEVLVLMQQKLPSENIRIRKEIFEIKFLQGLYEEVLFEALSYAMEIEIWQWLLQRYYKPFQEEHQNVFQTNKDLLENYEYFYGNVGQDQCKILWFDENGKLCFEQSGRVVIYTDSVELSDKQEVPIICNLFNIHSLITYQTNTDNDEMLPGCQEPIYLYYPQNMFDALIQCVDLTKALSNKRIVLLVGEEHLIHFFEGFQTVMPHHFLGVGKERIEELLQEVKQKKYESSRIKLQKMNEYYEKSGDQIEERIKSKKPKILFWSCEFTTILKHHIRDCRKAAQKMGLETELMIEKGNIFRLDFNTVISCFNAFRPDIIFAIDHFRFEFDLIPEEVIWVCWVQDPMPFIMDKDSPAKLKKRDLVLNHFTSWKMFWEIGYHSDQLMDAPIPASPDVYRTYDLSKEEYDKYACDICFVCHGSDVDAHIKEFAKENDLDESQQEILTFIYKGYQQYVYKTGGFFYSKELFGAFIEDFFIQYYGEKVKPFLSKLVDILAGDMYLWYNQRVFRQTLVDWILDAGFTNIKLWGNGWKDSIKYQGYAMGPAENGESLSKIYQASKIVIGNNITTTTAARAWETMLSGGFYMSNYVPEEEDISDIRKIVEIGKDMIMFYGKEDLIEKIKYYLEHEDERQIMIERGRKVALEKMTFDILMKRTLSEVARRLEE